MLKGDRAQLRALEPEDVDVLYQWENDPAVWRVSHTLVPFSRHALEQFVLMGHDLQAHQQARFMMDVDGRAVGAIDLFDYDERNGRAGVAILIADEADRGQGYAAEALDLLITYCFEHLRLNQLYCNIGEQNAASRKLFEGKGFRLVGVKEQWLRTSGGWENECLYQLIK